jgi:dye decolorizing peroxidase
MSDGASSGGRGATRREVLVGALAAVVGVGAGGAAVWGATHQAPNGTGTGTGADTGQTARPHPVAATGRTQAGIARPGTPQRFGHLLVVDLDRTSPPREWLALLGGRIAAVTTVESETAPDGGGDLTVTVGLGPDIVAIGGADLPGAEQLPLFAGDDGIIPGRRGGDMLLAAYASDPGVLRSVLHDLLAVVPGAAVRWEQAMFRGPGEGTRVRNPLGFHDGIAVPHTDAELDENVWIPDGAFAGGSICVIRRLRLRIDDFRGLPVAEQERIVGRRRIDGAPLSGGGSDDDVNLSARTPEGEPKIDVHAHVRAAHPSFTGSHLMLRRGYAFDDGEQDAGLMFICFQRDLRTFVATQHRLDEVDALSAFSTPTASGTFLILPGFDAQHPLGSTLPAGA